MTQCTQQRTALYIVGTMPPVPITTVLIGVEHITMVVLKNNSS